MLAFVSLLLVSLLFTAVPPSANPNSKQNQAFLKELQNNGLNAEVVKTTGGRIWFVALQDDFLSWPNYFQTGVRSIRLVVLERNATTSSHDILDTLHDQIELPHKLWEAFGNEALPTTPTIRLRCHKWATFLDQSISESALTRSLTTSLSHKRHWRFSKQNADLEFHVLLHDDRITVEVPVLIRPTVIDELPKPGFKAAESFVFAKAVGIQPNDIVLDPMCGKGTFLVEAARTWPNATYIGVDASSKQLDNARENIAAAKVSVQLVKGDARNLSGFPDHSVGKILCCPPFGRQYGAAQDIPTLYRCLLQEWVRVLKRDGKIALLIDVGDNVEHLKHAIASVGLYTTFQREPFRLGKLQATILLVEARKCDKKYGRFDWEQSQGARDNWVSLRSAALPSLVPYSKRPQ